MTEKRLTTIPVFRPSMGDEEVASVAETLRSGWIATGPRVKQLEEAFAAYVGAPYAIAFNSCTAALHLALAALGVNDGEVITTPITFVATGHVILYNGARPVFADVQRDTLNLDPKDVERKITSRTRAILPVHYGGHPCDMDELRALAARHKLEVIEDAAHACGALYRGRKIGSLSRATCFSFQAVKNMSTGDGGMVTTGDSGVMERLMRQRWFGITSDTFQRSKAGAYSWYYEVDELGWKLHMNDIAAAIGLAQLKRLEKLNARRREIARRYNIAFADVEWLELPVERPYVVSSRLNYAMKVLQGDRNRLIAHLKERGISTTVHYTPIYMHPFYKRIGIKASCPVAEQVYEQLVLIPLFPGMTEEEIERVIDGVKAFKP